MVYYFHSFKFGECDVFCVFLIFRFICIYHHHSIIMFVLLHENLWIFLHSYLLCLHFAFVNKLVIGLENSCFETETAMAISNLILNDDHLTMSRLNCISVLLVIIMRINNVVTLLSRRPIARDFN